MKFIISYCLANSFDNDQPHYETNNYQQSYHHTEATTVVQIVAVALGILLVISGVIVCIIRLRRSQQLHSRLQGKHYEHLAGEYLDDDIIEWEVASKADKQS